MPDDSVEPTVPAGMKVFSSTDMEHRRATDFAQVYTNSATFSISFFDVSIGFGQIVSPEPNSMFIEDRATVTMSLEHAKALAEGIQRMLDHYEQTHGPIRKAK